MNPNTKEYVLKWLDKAGHDLIAASTIIEHQPIILDTACFHCQQAVEKYLKAFLIYKKVDFPKTHDVVLLYQPNSGFRKLETASSGINGKYVSFSFENSTTFRIQKLCIEFDSVFNVDLKELNDYAVDIRYPDSYLSPELVEANEYLAIAANMKTLVESKITW